jgi:hypothetical protein
MQDFNAAAHARRASPEFKAYIRALVGGTGAAHPTATNAYSLLLGGGATHPPLHICVGGSSVGRASTPYWHGRSPSSEVTAADVVTGIASEVGLPEAGGCLFAQVGRDVAYMSASASGYGRYVVTSATLRADPWIVAVQKMSDRSDGSMLAVTLDGMDGLMGADLLVELEGSVEAVAVTHPKHFYFNLPEGVAVRDCMSFRLRARLQERGPAVPLGPVVTVSEMASADVCGAVRADTLGGSFAPFGGNYVPPTPPGGTTFPPTPSS